MSNNVYFLSKLIEHQALSGSNADKTKEDSVGSLDFGSMLSGMQAQWLEQLFGTSSGYSGAAVGGGAEQYDELISAASQRYGVDADLIKAVTQVESDFRPNVVSSVGAQGLMQLMPGTAREMGVTDSFDPAQNIDGGTRYLARQIDRFGDVKLALAAYNCGPSYVAQKGITDSGDAAQYSALGSGVRGYVSKVMALYDAYKADSAAKASAGTSEV